MDRAIRQKAQRDFQQGKVSPATVAKAQSDLAAREIMRANAQGKVSQGVMKALGEQAKTSGEQISLMQEMESQLRDLQQVQRSQQEAVKGARQRSRNDRRSTRG